MSFFVDTRPFGACPADAFTKATMAATRRLPANYFGLRVSMPLRRLAIDRLGDRAVDTTVWGASARLYPFRNSCEKVALFTPQLYDPLERAALAVAIDRRLAAGGTFTFIDVGANVGLYSLFVAARAGGHGRIVAVEPQPGIADRLEFNLKANPGCRSQALRVAVSDTAGEIDMAIHLDDAGGTAIHHGASLAAGEALVRVPCRTLADIVAAAQLSAIDAIKLDIEGHEDRALGPYLRSAPRTLLPRLILIEQRDWAGDLAALLDAAGYTVTAQSRHNAVYALAAPLDRGTTDPGWLPPSRRNSSPASTPGAVPR